MAKKRDELIPFLVKLSPMDKHILDEMASSMGLYASDIIRLSLWNYVNIPKNSILKATLKELARSRELSFKMDILKELERSNNRQIFFIDGFRTMLKAYHSKYAPVDGVRRFVTIKLIALYSLFVESKHRKDYLAYVRSHYIHYYPNERKWFDAQVNTVKSLKKDEKDKLLLNLSRELSHERGMSKMQEVDGVILSKPLPKMPAKGREADGDERAGEE